MQKTELEIWTGFIAGDDSCYKEIYTRYVDILFNYGIQFSSNEDFVKDAVHDVFVYLYSKRSKLKTDVQLKFYLFTCLKNHLFNLMKRGGRFEPLDLDEKHTKCYYIADEETDKQIISDEESLQTVELLNVLSDRQREVIYYRYIQEMEMDEICQLMSMNYQSAQNLIQRALKKLRESHSVHFLFF